MITRIPELDNADAKPFLTSELANKLKDSLPLEYCAENYVTLGLFYLAGYHDGQRRERARRKPTQ